jgi:hypothetical protein
MQNQEREDFGKRQKESPRTAGLSENPSGPSGSPNLMPKENTSTYTSGSSGASVSAAGTAAAKSLLEQAKDTAGHAYDAATEKAVSTFDEKKSDISGGLSSVADSVRTVSQNLKTSDAQNAITSTTAKYTDTAARKLEDIANYFETKDLKTIMHDTEDFARRNPAIFIGGAAVLGLLAARFLKSSKPKYLQAAAGEPWSTPRDANLGGSTMKPSQKAGPDRRTTPNAM